MRAAESVYTCAMFRLAVNVPFWFRLCKCATNSEKCMVLTNAFPLPCFFGKCHHFMFDLAPTIFHSSDCSIKVIGCIPVPPTERRRHDFFDLTNLTTLGAG